MSVTNEIAELLYTEDSVLVPWTKALPEDRAYYLRVADVIVDAVVQRLRSKDNDFDGGFSAAIEFLQAESDIDRLHRR